MKEINFALMTRAVNKDDEIVSIDSVPSGLSCECTCLDCGALLQAKKGKIKAHHFAHHSTESAKACNWKPESELHIIAKEIIAEDRKALLPVGTINPKAKEYVFDDVILEKRHGSRIPDIKAYINGELVIIEIAVTSFCSKEKIIEYKKQNLNVIEFDLKQYKRSGETISKDDVRKIMLECSSRLLSISKVGDFATDYYNHNEGELMRITKEAKNENSNLDRISKEIRKEKANLNKIIDESKVWYGRMKNSKEIFERDREAFEHEIRLDMQLESKIIINSAKIEADKIKVAAANEERLSKDRIKIIDDYLDTPLIGDSILDIENLNKNKDRLKNEIESLTFEYDELLIRVAVKRNQADQLGVEK